MQLLCSRVIGRRFPAWACVPRAFPPMRCERAAAPCPRGHFVFPFLVILAAQCYVWSLAACISPVTNDGEHFSHELLCDPCASFGEVSVENLHSPPSLKKNQVVSLMNL